MLRFVRTMLLAASIASSSVLSAQAGVVISFAQAISEVEIPTSGSSSFTVEVRMRTDVGTAAITGYDIPIDLAAPEGKGLPLGWSVSGFTKLLDFGSDAFFPGPLALTPDQGDILVGDVSLGGSVEFGTDPLSLFSFTIDVTPEAQPGQFTATVLSGSLLDIGGVAKSDVTIENSALFQATSVPEPSGLILLVAASPLFFRRRRD